MSVRLRRLQADYEAVRALVRRHPKIDIEGVYGNPPEKYRLILKVKSLRERGSASGAGTTIEEVREHRLEVTLPQGYPRDAPLCRMLTPVFHPNIAPHAVCIGDHWTAGESLDLMIQRVGEMLAFQSYNIKSPLNGRAAQWVSENLSALPTDRDEFFLDLAAEAPSPPFAPAPAAAATAGGPCANCGNPVGEGLPCSAGHPTCSDCALHCTKCGNRLCLVCGTYPCKSCVV